MSSSLHELAVEDALGPHQRPKLDRYATHLFLSCHAVRVDAEAGALDETEIDAFINERWLITVRKNDGFSIEPVLERWDRSPDLAVHGVSFLLYGLLDVIVDSYFDAVQSFDEYYEEVSDGIFSDRPLDPAQQRHWFDMRRAMVRFHRLVVPMREAISSLMRREHVGRRGAALPLLPGRVRPHPAGQRVLRFAPRSRQHHRRDESQPAGLPAEPDREEGQQLGGHHRGARPRHRLLRHERPLPRLRQGLGCRRLRGLDARWHCRPLPAVPPHRLAVGDRKPHPPPRRSTLARNPLGLLRSPFQRMV